MLDPFRCWPRAALLFVCSAIAVAACGSTAGSPGANSKLDKVTIPPKPEPGVFTMGINPWIGYAPWYVADALGYFKKAGLNLRLVNIPNSDQGNAAFVAGKLDAFNTVPITAVRLAMETGPTFRMILAQDYSITDDAIIAGRGISSVQQLRGKRVAYEVGTTSDTLLHAALARYHIPASSISTVPMDASAAGGAAIAGRVTAAVTWEPYISAALHRPGFKRIFYAGEDPGLISDAVLVPNSVIQKRPGDVAALVRVWDEGLEYLKAHPASGDAITAKALQTPLSGLKTAFAGDGFYSASQIPRLLSGAWVPTLRQAATLAYDEHQLPRPMTAKLARGLMDPEFANAALKAGSS